MKRKRSKAVATKALAFEGTGVTWQWGLPGTQFDYAAEVKDGLKSSVVVAALNWIMRAFPEAPAVVERKDSEQWRPAQDHDLAKLLRAPNPFYGGRVLMMATAMDFCFGEAFWHKIRNGMGELVELWWIPRALITPKWDDNKQPGVFITHYEYSVNGKLFILPVEDVVHFRFGMDPANIRRGWSQLAAVFREVYVDDQASNFTASILRNLGIIGIVIAPDGTTTIPPAKLPELKDYVEKGFTGDNRGKGLVFTHPMKPQVLQYNLQGFDVGPIRDISEERVCAALGIPAAVIGFGTGLQQTKVGATMREMIQLAWRGSIMPTQEIIADELDRSLLPEFQKNTDLFRVKFDASQVRALWEDEREKATRLSELATSGVITLAEARAPLGFEVKPEHDVYYRPSNVTAVKTPGEKVEPPKPVEPAKPEPAPKESQDAAA